MPTTDPTPVAVHDQLVILILSEIFRSFPTPVVAQSQLAILSGIFCSFLPRILRQLLYMVNWPF